MKNYFRVRWFTPDDESLLTDVELITRITKYIERYYEKSSSGISSIGSPHSFLSGGINPINSINLSMNNLNLNANLGTNLNCMGMGMSPTIPSNVPNVTSSMMNNYPPHMMHMMNMQNMSMNQNYQNPNTQYPYYLFGQQQNMMRQNMNQMSMGSNQMTNTSTGINSSGTPMNSTQNSTKRKASSMSNNNLDEDRSKLSGNNTGKYTCRFEIQIENDKDFQVARRLIGAKVSLNYNMLGLQHEEDCRDV